MGRLICCLNRSIQIGHGTNHHLYILKAPMREKHSPLDRRTRGQFRCCTAGTDGAQKSPIKSIERSTMGPMLKLEGICDGEAVPLPQNLDAITITTEKGTIYIDLAGQVGNMVLMRASADCQSAEVVRLILSPMGSGRLAVGVIRTAT